jgi:hypothetical protein
MASAASIFPMPTVRSFQIRFSSSRDRMSSSRRPDTGGQGGVDVVNDPADTDSVDG